MSIAKIQTYLNFWPFQFLFVTSQFPSWQPPVENELLQLSLEQDSNRDLQTVALKYIFLHRNLSKFDQKLSQGEGRVCLSVVQEKTEGTADCNKTFLPVKHLLKSVDVKCAEQTFV